MSVLGRLAGGGRSELAGWCGGCGCSCSDVNILPDDIYNRRRTLGHSVLFA